MKFASAGVHACGISHSCRLLSAEAAIRSHTELRMKGDISTFIGHLRRLITPEASTRSYMEAPATFCKSARDREVQTRLFGQRKWALMEVAYRDGACK